MTRFGYFGPRGTFTEMALHAWPPAAEGEHTAYDTVDAALAAARTGDVDAAMVPIENSVEGGVTTTLDALATGGPLIIVGEVIVPITFVLAARPGVTLSDITAIGTHSHAWAQVRGWVAANVPGATYVPTLSTASSAVALAEAGSAPGEPPFQAAVCAPIAAEHHGLQILAHDIGDMTGAVTRFVLVARPDAARGMPGAAPARTGADKTTLTLFQRDNHAGGLLELLEQFATRGINLTRLESRPTKRSMGSYCFSVDFEGHVLDERVGEALMGLKRVCADVVFLGSYPRHDQREVHVAPSTTDAEFVDARRWLDTLRQG